MCVSVGVSVCVPVSLSKALDTELLSASLSLPSLDNSDLDLWIHMDCTAKGKP